MTCRMSSLLYNPASMPDSAQPPTPSATPTALASGLSLFDTLTSASRQSTVLHHAQGNRGALETSTLPCHPPGCHDEVGILAPGVRLFGVRDALCCRVKSERAEGLRSIVKQRRQRVGLMSCQRRNHPKMFWPSARSNYSCGGVSGGQLLLVCLCTRSRWHLPQHALEQTQRQCPTLAETWRGRCTSSQ
jgi:hypothetical protein